jgi:hypothetical protein
MMGFKVALIFLFLSCAVVVLSILSGEFEESLYGTHARMLKVITGYENFASTVENDDPTETDAGIQQDKFQQHIDAEVSQEIDSNSIVASNSMKMLFSKFLNEVGHQLNMNSFDRSSIIEGVHFPAPEVLSPTELGKIIGSPAEESAKQLMKIAYELPYYLEAKHGLEKTYENMKGIYNYFSQEFIGNQDFLPENYQFFGQDEAQRLLVTFLRSNPLFTSSMKLIHTIDDNGIESIEYHIKAFDPLEPTWFSRFVETYDQEFPRVNVILDAHLQVKSFEVFSVSNKSMLRGSAKKQLLEMSEEEALGRLLFLLSYYFECVHTLTHIYHPLMVSAMVDASQETLHLLPFAKQYQKNLFVKYVEVKILLLAENAGLTGQIYRGDRKKLVALLGEVMHVWGSCQSVDDFLSKFLLKDLLNPSISSSSSKNKKLLKSPREILEQSDILTQFFLHADLIAPYAQEVDEIFREYEPNYESSTMKLRNFCEHTGPNGLRVQSVQSWIELMRLTGMLHGMAQSGTRLCVSIPVFRYFHEERRTFDTLDIDKDNSDDGIALMILFGTMVGIMEDHDIYSIPEKTTPWIRDVQTRYAGLGASYKMNYCKKIRAVSPKEFAELGWILTDFCPDMIDNKQLTIAAYV